MPSKRTGVEAKGGFSPDEEPHSIDRNGIRIPWSIINYKIKPDDAVRYLMAKYNKTEKVYKLTTDINTQALIDDLMITKQFIAPAGESIDTECKNTGIEMFCYNGGVYKPNGTHIIKTFCYNKVKSFMMKKNFEIILDYIKVHKRMMITELNNQNVLTLIDCNYNWKTHKPEPHSPKILNTISIPVKWNNPSANVQPFQDFLEKVMLPNEIQAMYELIGYCLYYGNMIIRELFIFYGSQTACGKTVCANVITHLLGADNCNGATLTELVRKRFASSMIVGKMLNVCPEEPQGTLPTGKIKAWTGQDRTNTERKGKDERTDPTTAKFIVLSNHLPDFKTSEESIFTRINVISFPHSFKDDMDDKLTEKLTTPDVLSGILHKSIEAFKELEKHGRFSNWKPTETRERMVHTVSNSLRAFAEMFAERGEFDDEMTKHEFHIIYTDNFCNVIGPEAKVMPKIVCGKLLPKILDYIEDRQRSTYDVEGIKTGQERVWRHIKWRDPSKIKGEMRELLKSMGKPYPDNWEPLDTIKCQDATPEKPRINKNIIDGYGEPQSQQERMDVVNEIFSNNGEIEYGALLKEVGPGIDEETLDGIIKHLRTNGTITTSKRDGRGIITWNG